MKKQINDLLLKMQTGENCIGETANELLNLFSVSGCSLDELKMLKDHYTERTNRHGNAQNYREAHEDDIRKGTVEHIIAIVNNR